MDRKEVRITSPCTLDWQKMTPAEGGRFCGDCKKVVRNLSSMTEREARALLKNAGNGELCVRFVYDEHGRVFFGKDAPKKDALLPASFLHRAKRAAAAAAVAALPFATQACELVAEPLGITSQERENQPPEVGELMGGVALDDRPQPPPTDDGDAGTNADASSADATVVDAANIDGQADAPDASADSGSSIPMN
jgi:hypothetical protein